MASYRKAPHVTFDDIEKMIKGDKMATAKVMGTFWNGNVVLDKPLDYVAVFDVDGRKARNLEHGKRYEFVFETTKGVKPSFVTANEASDDYKYLSFPISIDLHWDMIKSHEPQEDATLSAVKHLTHFFKDGIFDEIRDGIFDKIRKNYLDVAEQNGFVEVGIYHNITELMEAYVKLNAKDDVNVFNIGIASANSASTSYEPQFDEGEFVGDFYLQSDVVKLLPVFQKAIEKGERFSFLATGEAGYGKTSMFQAIAERLGLPILVKDCSVVQNTTDWFGIMQAKDGSTLFDPSDMAEFIRKGNCLIVLDEVNRMDIDIANGLMPILDHRGSTVVKNTEIVAGSGIMFCATLNEGVEYTGVGGMLDKAFKSRFYGKVDVRPLPQEIEKQVIARVYELEDEAITQLVRVMNHFRDTIERQRTDGNFMTADVSTRTTKMVAWWMEKGLDISASLEYALFNFVDPDERATLTDNAKIQGLL